MRIKWRHESIWARIVLDSTEYELGVRCEETWTWKVHLIKEIARIRTAGLVAEGTAPNEKTARRKALQAARKFHVAAKPSGVRETA